MIERRLENLLALDYPAEKLELVVASDASTDRTDELVERVAGRVAGAPDGLPAWGKVAAQNRAVREQGDVVAFSDANAVWAADALDALVANSRRPRRRLRLRAARARGGGRARTRRASTGATRWGCASRSRGSARSRAATARSTRCGAPTTSRSTRFGPRPRVPVPDGAAGTPRGLRARRARVREADALERDRVPPQGADVRALLADHAAGLDAARLPPGYLVEMVSHRLLRYWSGVLHVVLLGTSRAPGEGRVYALVLGASSRFLAARRRRASPATTCS